MSALLRDLRYAIRQLANRPAFTLVVVLVLALGTGANTAVFSVLNAVVLRPLPYADASRLYALEGNRVDGGTQFSVPDYLAWKERTRVFEQMAAAQFLNRVLTQVDEPEQVFGLMLTPECLPMLGVQPMLGRSLSNDDYRADAPPVVLIGHRLWQRRFHSDRQVVGRTLALDGRVFTVIGVMPSLFDFDSKRYEFWMPLVFGAEQLSHRDWMPLKIFARLKAGFSRREAEGEAEAMTRSLVAQFPDDHYHWKANVQPMAEYVAGESRRTLWMLLGAVGFVMLIACFNVANLLLARATERGKEMAVRIALGAGRARLVRQLLTESLLLALAGGALGLLIAALANRTLFAAVPAERDALPRLSEISIDLRVLGFTLLLCVACALIFGLVPAWRTVRADLNETLKESGRTGTTGTRVHRLRNLLIIAEVALALVLLIGAALMLRSFAGMLRVDPGFQTHNLLTMRLPMPVFRVKDRSHRPLYYSEILQQVQAVPGVEAAALSTVLPLTGAEAVLTFSAEGTPPLAPGEKDRMVPYRAVSAEYFRTLGIPLLLGRTFSDADQAGAPRVAIVNRALARQFWPGENPIGKQLHMESWVPIVGVVANVKHKSLASEPEGELYLPYLQFLGAAHSSLVIRTHAPPASMAATIKKKIRELQPDQPVVALRTYEQAMADLVSEPRLYTVLLGVFGALALALAAAGVYGVLSCSATQRRQEIGIRMALGASRVDILRMMVRHGGVYVLAGIAVGLGGAFAATRLLSTLLYNVKPTDPATFIVVSVLLAAVALVAIYVPSRRATKVDPIEALRCE